MGRGPGTGPEWGAVAGESSRIRHGGAARLRGRGSARTQPMCACHPARAATPPAARRRRPRFPGPLDRPQPWRPADPATSASPGRLREAARRGSGGGGSGDGGSFYRPFLPCHSLVRATPHPQETLPRIRSSGSLVRHSGLFPESDMGMPRAPSKGTDSLICPAVLAEPWHFLSQLRGQSSLFPVSHYFLLQNRVTALGKS